jgi:5'-nucleotidase
MKRALLLSAFVLAACATAPPQPVHVVIVGTTDVHGWFDGHRPDDGPQVGGVTLLASYLDALRSQSGNHLLLVDSGDLFQGTLESNFFEGEPVVKAYNLLGYAASAVGNHEFDYGPIGPTAIARDGDDPVGALKKNAAMAAFPLLAANVTEKATGATPAWAKPYTMVGVAGARIGVIGLSTPDTPNVTVGANVRALSFGDPVPATVDAANALRRQGADAVIVIAHMGGEEATRFLDRLPPHTIDAYFAGHTHKEMNTVMHDIPVLQGLAYGVEFSTLDLWITPGRGPDSSRTAIRPLTMICAQVWSGTERCDAPAPAGATLVPRTFLGRAITPDARLAKGIKPYVDRVAAKRAESIGATTTAAFTRSFDSESTLGDLLADVMRRAFDADVAIVNSGGIRADLRAGNLVYGDVFATSPFDNYPAIVRMTGAQIREVLRITAMGGRGLMQVSGLRYTVDVAAKDVSVTLDPDKVYRVVMSDFLALGGEGFDAVTKTIPADRIEVLQNRKLYDVFAEALHTMPQPLTPKLDGRVTVVNR